jgi:cysteine desulfurase family protein
VSADTVYLDNAATSYPKPSEVHDRMRTFLLEFGANPGRGSYRMVHEVERQMAEARRVIAEFFNAPDPARVIFTLNATDALNMGLKGLLGQGDHVVTSTVDHNSVIRPLNRMEREGMITVTRVRPDGHGVVSPGAVAAALQPGTRLVALLHGSNVSGALLPVGEIGQLTRQRGISFLVDAAQTAGVWPVDIRAMNIDMLAIPGHKGLLGPAGTGALILGEGVELKAWREGGTGGNSAHPVQPEEYPHHMEAGTLNTPGIAGLVAGIRYIERRGIDDIRSHDLELVRRIMEALADHAKLRFYGPPPSAERVPVIAFNVEGQTPDEVAGILDASFNIGVRAGLHCAPGAHREMGTFPLGSVRASPGPFTQPGEIDRLVEAIRSIAG